MSSKRRHRRFAYLFSEVDDLKPRRDVTQACCLIRGVDILSARNAQVENLRDKSGKMPELRIAKNRLFCHAFDLYEWLASMAKRGISVAQVSNVSNLLYRGLPAGYALNNRELCGLEIRDIADWKSALRRCSRQRRRLCR